MAATTTSDHCCTRQKVVAHCALVGNPITVAAPVVRVTFRQDITDL